MAAKQSMVKEVISPEEEDVGVGLVSSKAPWTSLFKGPNLTAKGNSLTFITPTISDGKPMDVFDKIDIAKMSTYWDRYIIMYVVGDLPSICVVFQFIEKEWKVGKSQVYLHDEGYSMVIFNSIMCRER